MVQGPYSSLGSSSSLQTYKPTISAVLISCNEAEVIEPCLQSVAPWVTEIIVVDMDSTDGTQEIARRYADRIIRHPRLPFVEPARNFALAYATCDWILLVDPDERVPQPLAQELCRLAQDNTMDVIKIVWQQVQFGAPVHSVGASDSAQPRFFRRGVLSWPERIHQVPDLTGLRVYTIPGAPGMALLHDTWRTVSVVLDKIMRYSPRDVENMLASGTHFSFAKMMRAAINMFVNRMFIGKAYEDGMPGLLTALYFTIYTLTIHAELWEADGKPEAANRQVRSWGRRLSKVIIPLYRGQRFMRGAR